MAQHLSASRWDGVTGSAAWLSAVTTAALVPMVAMLLLRGIADRYRRDTVLFLVSLGVGQVGVAFFLLVHQHPAFLLLPATAHRRD
ncbi:hypothetical protein ACQP2K_17245 [Microbispora siamensis]